MFLFIRIYLNLLEFIRIYWNLLEFIVYFLVFLEQKSCLHKPSNFPFWVIPFPQYPLIGKG
jgi:hypothetical protein